MIPENGISKLTRFILIGLVLWSDAAEDSVKKVNLQELYGERNTVIQVFAFYYNRHLEVLFTRPQSMDNMRKSKGIFPVDVRLTSKIRLSVIPLISGFDIYRKYGVRGYIDELLIASLKSTTRQQRKCRSKFQVQVCQSISSLCQFVLKLLKASGTS